MLVRPAMLFFLPLAALWLICAAPAGTRGRRSWSPRLPSIAPWTVRNMRVYGTFVLVASEGGVTFWTGNHPLARGEGDLAANPDIKRAELEFRRAHPGLTAEAARAALLPRRLAVHRAASRSGGSACCAKKAFYTVVPIGPSYTLHSTRYLGCVARVVPAAAAARGRRRRAAVARQPPARRRSSCSAASACSSVSCFFPQERFRIPVIDPALIVCCWPRRSRLGAPRVRRASVIAPAERRSSSCRPTTSGTTCRVLVRGVLAHPGFRHARSSTTARRTAPARSRTRSRAEYPGRVEVMHRTGQRGLGRSYIDGLRMRSACPAPI